MPSPPLALGQEGYYSLRTSAAEFLRQDVFAHKSAANGIGVENQFSAPMRGGISMAVINPQRYQAWVLATAIESAESESADCFSQGDHTKDHETDCEMDLDITDECIFASGNSTNSETCSITNLSDSDDEDKRATTTGVSARSLEAKASEFRGSSYRRRLVDFRCMDHRTYLETLGSSSSTTPSSLTSSAESSLGDFDSDAEAELSSRTASSSRLPSAASKVDHGLHLVTSALAASSSQPEIHHGVISAAQAKRSDKSVIERALSQKAVGVRHVHFETEEVDDTDIINDTDADDDDDDDSDSAFEMDEDSDDDSDVEMRGIKWAEARKLWK